MKKLVIVVLALAGTCCAQSLGDVAKQSREQPKKKAAKTFTNEDLPSERQTSPDSAATDQERELEHMKQVLEDICADPRTNRGRTLSDYDKQMMDEGVKPLRVRVDQQKQWHKETKAALDQLEQEAEKSIQAITPKDRPMNDDDMAKFKAIQQDYEAKRDSLLKQTEAQQKEWVMFNRRLEEISAACPEAAKSVPD
jgi:hypothetical protein